jgi:hypothetical protein
MKPLLLAVAVASLGMPSRAFGADKSAPAPAPIPVAPAGKAPETQISKAALDAALRPLISDLSPRRVHALGKLIIQGANFGRDMPARPLRMRMGGNGFSSDLPAARWTERMVEVEIPKGVPPGRYYVGVTDARSQWASAIDQTFEVLPDVREVPVTLDVTFRCLFDVLAAPPSIPIRFMSPGGVGVLASTTLASAGHTPAPFGGVVYHFRGSVSLRIGSAIAVPDSATRFTVDVWDDPLTYWQTSQCADHKRTTSGGAPLHRPMRQSREAVLAHGEVLVTDETTALSFPTTMLIDAIGSIAVPPPICPPAGCT